MDSRIREGIVDRGIERGEWEMRNLSKQLGHDRSDQEPHVGPVGEHNSGQMSAEASDQTGTTPVNLKLSYTHILSSADIIQPSIIFGVTRDATDAVVSLDYIHRF